MQGQLRAKRVILGSSSCLIVINCCKRWKHVERKACCEYQVVYCWYHLKNRFGMSRPHHWRKDGKGNKSQGPYCCHSSRCFLLSCSLPKLQYSWVLRHSTLQLTVWHTKSWSKQENSGHSISAYLFLFSKVCERIFLTVLLGLYNETLRLAAF